MTLANRANTQDHQFVLTESFFSFQLERDSQAAGIPKYVLKEIHGYVTRQVVWFGRDGMSQTSTADRRCDRFPGQETQSQSRILYLLMV